MQRERFESVYTTLCARTAEQWRLLRGCHILWFQTAFLQPQMRQIVAVRWQVKSLLTISSALFKGSRHQHIVFVTYFVRMRCFQCSRGWSWTFRRNAWRRVDFSERRCPATTGKLERWALIGLSLDQTLARTFFFLCLGEKKKITMETAPPPPC